MSYAASLFQKVPWFVSRFGVSELWRKPLRVVLAPLIIPTLKRDSFEFNGWTLPYFHHRYNMTWANERSVEVPIARQYIHGHSGRTLEIGNVLGHYSAVNHLVIDKFESGEHVANVDIEEHVPAFPYDLIVSVSTFEHFGFDDDRPDRGQKIVRALQLCRSWLAPGGLLVVTVPLGYNPHLDRLLENGIGATQEHYLVRERFDKWIEASSKPSRRAYRKPYPYANAIAVLEFHR